MRLTYEQFCHIVNNEILYLQGEFKVEGVQWGRPTSNPLPSVVSLQFLVPEEVYERQVRGVSLTSDEPQDPQAPATDEDAEVAMSYEFAPASFQGEIVDLNTIMVHSDEGDVVTLEVYHEVPVDIVAAYPPAQG